MTHKILDHDTQKIIYRSAVGPKKSSTPNHRLAPHGGEVSASSDPSEDKISSGPPLGAPEDPLLEQKAPTVFIRSRDTSLVGLSYFHIRRMGRGTELRLQGKLLKLLTRTMVKG